jgi:hypothetical protein
MGDTPTETLRALKRRLSDVVFRTSSPTPNPSNPVISITPLDIGADDTALGTNVGGVIREVAQPIAGGING